VVERTTALGALPLPARQAETFVERPVWDKAAVLKRLGYSRSARRADIDSFIRVGLSEVVAYTAPDNLRSQTVMTRLQMQRDPSRDFMADYDSIKYWRRLVWAASGAGISQHRGRDARPWR
jgi:hypothetical protein